MSASSKNKIVQGTAIVDAMGDPIVHDKWYKIRVADGSEITTGRHDKQYIIALAPTNTGEFYRVQVDTGKNTHWKNGTGSIKIWSRGGRDCWTVSPTSTDIVGMRSRYLMPKPDDTKATQQQWIQGVQDHKGGIWLAMGQYALRASHTLEGTINSPLDYMRAIKCTDQGANVTDYNFECTFVPMPSLSI